MYKYVILLVLQQKSFSYKKINAATVLHIAIQYINITACENDVYRQHNFRYPRNMDLHSVCLANESIISRCGLM